MATPVERPPGCRAGRVFPTLQSPEGPLALRGGLSTAMTFLMVKVFPKSHRLVGSACQRRSHTNCERFLLMSRTGTVFFFFFACCASAALHAVTSAL